MVTARPHRFSPFVHAVDDFGAVCGATPRGVWVPNASLPLTCPKCYLKLSVPRYVFCGSPDVSAGIRTHVRLVGVEGARRSTGAGSFLTLCGKPAGWDMSPVEKTPAPPGQGDELCRDCVKGLRKARTGLAVAA